jgi:flagellar protein FlgJ
MYSGISAVNAGKVAYQENSSTAKGQELARLAKNGNKDELKKVCEEFEAIFVKMMLDSMRKTLSDNTLIPKNSGEKLFEDQLYDEYAKKMSSTADLGIASMMYKQLSDQNAFSGTEIPGSVISINSKK